MMHLGISLSPFGQHPAAWLGHPHDRAALSLQRLAAQVQRAQGAVIDFVRLDDAQTQRPLNGLPLQTVPFEPTTLVAALATLARQIGFVATAATGQHELYNLARRYASLDLISEGRVGWCVVPSGRSTPWDQEYVEVVQALWESWEPDAFVYDKVAGRFFMPDKMHVLDHRGRHFTVRGPLNVNPSPQGRPAIGYLLSTANLALTASTADVVFVTGKADPDGAPMLEQLNLKLHEVGRKRSDIRVLADITPWIGTSRAEAKAGAEELNARALPGSAAPRVGREVFGTASEVADVLQGLFEREAFDGFTFLPPSVPEGLDALLDRLIPELQKRNLAGLRYQGTTLRDHLGLARPASPGFA